jgi:heme-degrading monooxygenase HmoA
MYAVIFSSTLSADTDGYEATAEAMVQRCSEQPGFLGIESVRDAAGRGITVCLWDSLEAIAAWREDREHRTAQEEGQRRWYAEHRLLVCEVVRGT